MLKREAMRAVTYLLRRGAMTQSRMSFVFQSCNDMSVIERDGHHNDTIFYPRDVCLYFDVKGRQITSQRFEHQQVLLDAAEANLHLTHIAATQED